MRLRYGHLVLALVLLFSSTGTLAAQSGGATRAAAAIIADIRRADYAGDRAALLQLYQELRPTGENALVLSRVHYWRGFAMWRRAFNGFNDSAPADELERDLRHAVGEFETSRLRDPAFVDADIATISCLQSLAFLRRGDQKAAGDLVARFIPLLKQTMDAAPENPRLLWVQGATEFYAIPGTSPAQLRERRVTAIKTYEKGVRAARAQKNNVDPLEPNWGEAELLMNLAWSSLNDTEPRPAAALQFATEALQLVPNWHYVRDILIPQIKAVK